MGDAETTRFAADCQARGKGSGLGVNIRVTNSGFRNTIILRATDATSIATAKGAIAQILQGEKVVDSKTWSNAFMGKRGSAMLRELARPEGCYIHRDHRRKELRIFGKASARR